MPVLTRSLAALARPARSVAAAVTLAGLAVGTTQVVLAPVAMARYGFVVSTTNLNVRSGPSTSSDVIGSLNPGDRLAQVGQVTGGFVPVRFQGQTAYVSASYVTGESTETGSASSPSSSGGQRGTAWATDDVNVRTGPSLDAAIVGLLLQGQSVRRTGTTSGPWTQVSYQGGTRWIYGAYLTGSSPSTRTTKPLKVHITGKAITTTPLMVRSAPGTDFDQVGELPTGTIVSLTGPTSQGVSQILWQSQLRWVNSSFLKPVSTTVSIIGPRVPAAVGTRYATTSLNVRSAPDPDSDDVVDEVPTGTALKITGTVTDGYAQVIYQGAARWVTAVYLSTQNPNAGGGSTPTSSKGAAAVAFAYAQLGKPYVYGATGPDSFDCSGLTQAAWASAGVSIPRVSYDQLSDLPEVSQSDLQPGDIVGYYGGGHVAIYVGDGYVIHAPHTGDVVRKVPLSYMPYYKAVRP